MGMTRNTNAHATFATPSHHSAPPNVSCRAPNDAVTAAAIQLASLSTRTRRATRSL